MNEAEKYVDEKIRDVIEQGFTYFNTYYRPYMEELERRSRAKFKIGGITYYTIENVVLSIDFSDEPYLYKTGHVSRFIDELKEALQKLTEGGENES